MRETAESAAAIRRCQTKKDLECRSTAPVFGTDQRTSNLLGAGHVSTITAPRSSRGPGIRASGVAASEWNRLSVVAAGVGPKRRRDAAAKEREVQLHREGLPHGLQARVIDAGNDDCSIWVSPRAS